MYRNPVFGMLGVLFFFGMFVMSVSAFAQELPDAEPEPEESSGEAETQMSVEGGLEFEGDVYAEDEESERADLSSWEWGAYRHHSNLKGTTGLFHMIEASSGEAGTLGIGVHGAYFKYSDYLIDQDVNKGSWGGANVRITPLDFLEIYAGIIATSNYNNSEYPRLFQAIGDMNLGIKGYYQLASVFSLGLDVEATFLNGVGDIAFDFSGTGVGLNLLGTFDFAEVQPKFPLRTHLNVGYMFDNSANLIEDIEAGQGGCGTDIDGDGHTDYSGCLSVVERTALGINRNDIFRMGIGLDFAFPYVTPIVEYHIDIPVNRQDFNCPDNIPGTNDTCMAVAGGSAMPQVLTAGLRFLPPIESLAIDIGVDVGLKGYFPTVHEMAAEAPYRILFGLSYSFDPIPNPVEIPPPPPCPECPLPPAPLAEIAGYVHDGASQNAAIEGASVEYLGLDLNPQVSGKDGRFRSYGLPAGINTLTVNAEGYEEATFDVEVPESGNVELDCPMKALPKVTTLAVRVIDDDGQPVGNVEVILDGPERVNLTTDQGGIGERELKSGTYTIAVNHEGYLRRVLTVNASPPGTRIESTIPLRARPTKSLVVVKKKRIVIKKKIHFETNSAEVKQDSIVLLDAIADTLFEHKEITSLEIQGHTDNRGKKDYNMDLSERRAQGIRDYLVKAGIKSYRLTSKGFGHTKPIAPNITGQGRARNRRVEFHILQKSE